MAREPLFSGLVVDIHDQAVDIAYVGDEPCYVVDDAGFKRHIPSEDVDLQVLEYMRELLKGHEDIITEQALQMLGQDDIFSQAVLKEQIENIERQFDQVLESGIPEEARAYMGMTGFKIVIDVHGDVLEVIQPGMISPGE